MHGNYWEGQSSNLEEGICLEAVLDSENMLGRNSINIS